MLQAAWKGACGQDCPPHKQTDPLPQIGPGHRFRSKVTLSDGASMTEGMHVTLIFGGRQGDSQTALM